MSSKNIYDDPWIVLLSIGGFLLTLVGLLADGCDMIESQDEDSEEVWQEPIFRSPVRQGMTREDAMQAMAPKPASLIHTCDYPSGEQALTWDVSEECMLFEVWLKDGVVTTIKLPFCTGMARSLRHSQHAQFGKDSACVTDSGDVTR